MRAFIAYELSDTTLEYIRKVNAQLEPLVNGRFVADRNLHLTLTFLGDISPGEVLIFIEVVRKAAALGMPEISLQKLVALGSVLGILVKSKDLITEAHKALKEGSREAGRYVEDRQFKPHVTIIRNYSSLFPVAEINKNVLIGNRPHPATAITLFESEQTKRGMMYNPIFSLGSK